jgi:hypothetical protein
VFLLDDIAVPSTYCKNEDVTYKYQFPVSAEGIFGTDFCYFILYFILFYFIFYFILYYILFYFILFYFM